MYLEEQQRWDPPKSSGESWIQSQSVSTIASVMPREAHIHAQQIRELQKEVGELEK
jgi:hypothetical protein